MCAVDFLGMLPVIQFLTVACLASFKAGTFGLKNHAANIRTKSCGTYTYDNLYQLTHFDEAYAREVVDRLALKPARELNPEVGLTCGSR